VKVQIIDSSFDDLFIQQLLSLDQSLENDKLMRNTRLNYEKRLLESTVNSSLNSLTVKI